MLPVKRYLKEKNENSIYFSSIFINLISQGNFGVNFGLNDDNFGSITDLKNKIDNYNLDIKNSTGFQFGVFSEIDLITFYIRPELNLIFQNQKCFCNSI